MSAPFLRTQNAGWHRFNIGHFEVTVIWDGWIDHTYEGFYPNADPAELERLKTEYELPTPTFPVDLNVVVVNTGEKLILIDAGMGREITWFGTLMGRLLENMTAAGIAPEDIDAVLMTHLHPDHVCGLIDPAGTAVFPNADLYCNDVDWAEWTDEARLSLNDHRGPWTQVAINSVEPYRDRLKLFKFGDELFAGVKTFSGAGHAAGQTAFIFESAGEKIVFTGDIAHHAVFDPIHPEWFFHMEYDTDPELGTKAKADLFALVTRENIRFHGYHFPFPGLGEIVSAGDGTYRYKPRQMTPRLE